MLTALSNRSPLYLRSECYIAKHSIHEQYLLVNNKGGHNEKESRSRQQQQVKRGKNRVLLFWQDLIFRPSGVTVQQRHWWSYLPALLGYGKNALATRLVIGRSNIATK